MSDRNTPGSNERKKNRRRPRRLKTGNYPGVPNSELEMSRRLTAWMGLIPFNTKKHQVLKFFKEFNPKSCNIVHKGRTTFCFIRFYFEADRANAIMTKGNCSFRGMKTVVNRSFNEYKGPRIGGRESYDERGKLIRY